MKRITLVLMTMMAFTLPLTAHAKHKSDDDSDDSSSKSVDCDDLSYGKNNTGQEKDYKLLACEKKASAKLEKDQAKAEKQLKAIEKATDPKSLTGDNAFENSNHDCFSGCEPSSSVASART